MEYLITDIARLSDKKSILYINYDYTIPLYNSEIRRYHFNKGEEVSSAILDEIKSDILVKRAKLRLMNILKTTDKTEHQLRQKLKEGYYGDDIIDIAIEYIRQYNYIDDSKIVMRYIDTHRFDKSKRAIRWELLKKGIVLDDYCERYLEEIDERETIRQILDKKNIDVYNIEVKEKEKLYLYFARKGFSHNNIKSLLS